MKKQRETRIAREIREALEQSKLGNQAIIKDKSIANYKGDKQAVQYNIKQVESRYTYTHN